MARIRLRIELNKGRQGIPLHKLALVVAETEKFLRMLGQDARLESGSGQWLGLDFSNGSLAYTAEYAAEVDVKEEYRFNLEFDNLRRGKPSQRVRFATRRQYTRIADPLDEDEVVSFGVYKEGSSEPDFVSLSKRDVRLVLGDLQLPVEAIGALQGSVHSVFIGAQPPYFNLRELSSQALVRCEYAESLYSSIVAALARPHAIVHVYGTVKTNVEDRSLDTMRVTRIEVAEQLTDEEFEKFFGCAPNFTGDLSTSEFLDRMRNRNE
jgi:hypothetical protein